MDEEVATHLLRAMLAIAAYRTATIPDLLIGLVEALELGSQQEQILALTDVVHRLVDLRCCYSHDSC